MKQITLEKKYNGPKLTPERDDLNRLIFLEEMKLSETPPLKAFCPGSFTGDVYIVQV